MSSRKFVKRVLVLRRLVTREFDQTTAPAGRDAKITVAGPVEANTPAATRPLVFRSEMDYISRCILDYPDTETGGQLFGYWTDDGVPVVMYAIGPGPRANHQVTFFNQDVNYLLKVGHSIRDRYGIRHIGEWHSHHRLGLASPSSHDANTMLTTIREKDLGRFLLCIGNCDDNGSSLNPFMCDERSCAPSQWNIIEGESPIRGVIDSSLSSVLVHPHVRVASYKSRQKTAGCLSMAPQYASGYWLNSRGSGLLLKRIQEYVQGMNAPSSSTSVKLDENGRVHLVTISVASNGSRIAEDILFPLGFPNSSPECVLEIGSEKEPVRGLWNYQGDTLKAFVQYYKSIIE